LLRSDALNDLLQNELVRAVGCCSGPGSGDDLDLVLTSRLRSVGLGGYRGGLKGAPLLHFDVGVIKRSEFAKTFPCFKLDRKKLCFWMKILSSHSRLEIVAS
jgi:hypothetical protein